MRLALNETLANLKQHTQFVSHIASVRCLLCDSFNDKLLLTNEETLNKLTKNTIISKTVLNVVVFLVDFAFANARLFAQLTGDTFEKL